MGDEFEINLSPFILRHENPDNLVYFLPWRVFPRGVSFFPCLFFVSLYYPPTY